MQKKVNLLPLMWLSRTARYRLFSDNVTLLVGGLWGQSVVSCNLAIWALPASGAADGGRVYTAHTATPFIQHADMRLWKFPLYHNRIEG